MVNMDSPRVTAPGDDRTARARIRDEALALFAARGPDRVTLRDVATAAGVSPALVVKHYGSKNGLREAVDAHVTGVFEAMLAQVTDPAAAELPTLAEAVARFLPADSAVPGYLARMLLDRGPVGSDLFGALYSLAVAALGSMVDAGTAAPGADPAVRAAFLLANDLAVLILRPHLTQVLGTDPLSAPGMARWGAEVFAVYAAGLGGTRHPPATITDPLEGLR
jgi:AcrR family transcriptional regulator